MPSASVALPVAISDDVPATTQAGVTACAAVPVQSAPPRGLTSRLAPESLHPSLWLGHQMARCDDRVSPSGYPALDVHLPGGGWPSKALTELLLSQTGIGEIRLLSPCLAAIQRAGRLVMVFDPPENLSAWALVQLGIDVEQLLLIDTRSGIGPNTTGSFVWSQHENRERRPGVRSLTPGAGSLWALEQALKSGHVGAVLAWLPPRLRGERLRRLQLAAHAHDGPAFVMREMEAQHRPTAAPLRIALKSGGADVLRLRLLKRRGPPVEAPVELQLPPVLSEQARRRAAAEPERIESPSALQAATFVNLLA